MQRVSLPPQERKNQILDVAQDLFITKGYQATTIDDILRETQIAKGTLYYHFAGKEEILTAMISRAVASAVDTARAVADSDATPLEKFVGVLASARMSGPNADLTDQLHVQGNAEFHLQSNVELIRGIAPILTQVVIEGIEQGVFATPQPAEDVEILLTAGGMLTDAGIFVGDEDELPRRTIGVILAAERLLGTAPMALTDLLGPRT